MDLDRLIVCNCSFCAKKGMMLAFIPAERFRLLSGEEELTDYLFNKKIIHHLFCKSCGVQSFARGSGHDGAPTIAVNVRCLDNVDADALTPVKYDGKNK